MAHNIREGLELHMDTFSRDLQLAALSDLDRLGGLVAGRGLGVLDLLDNVVALEDLAEDNVTAVEPPATTALAQSLTCMFWL